MNSEMKVFNPVDLDLSRSTRHHTPMSSGSFNAGRLIPGRCIFIQPGDSIKMRMQDLVKMSTPVYPTMDLLYEDVFFFFVPYRAILSRRYGTPAVNDAVYSWSAFIGAQDNLLNMPIPANGLKLPTLKISNDATGAEYNSLLSYFDLAAIKANNGKLSALPLMAYFAIWNENFRDPNLMDPITWNIDANGQLVPYGSPQLYACADELEITKHVNGDGLDPFSWVNALADDNDPDSTATDKADYWLPLPVCRFHGYFGSLLPWPQRNLEGVVLPLGNTAPVYLGANKNRMADVALLNQQDTALTPAAFEKSYVAESIPSGGVKKIYGGYVDEGELYPVGPFVTVANNAYADLSTATAANINALRMAIQKQRWYEKLARSGNRYDELEYGLFGVRPKDSGNDRPEYLGGKRITLNIEMVASTNGGTTSGSAAGAGSLGQLGGFSHTNDSDEYFYKSFDDWGVLMCLFCVRHHTTLSSGTDRHFAKLLRDDFYFPTFAHLGEQGTYDYEWADVAADSSRTVIGYNPAWEEDRTELDRVHNLLKVGRSLEFMTYAEEFTEDTTLLSFLNASSQIATVDKTLSVGVNSAGFQFVYQKNFDFSFRRCMPLDSIPGLMDHF